MNLKFDQVMFNSLVLTLERNFEVTFGIFSVLVFQINVYAIYLDIYLFKISYDQKCKNSDNLGLKIKFYQYFVFTKKDIQHICHILHQFNFCVLLICGNKIGND